MVIENEGNPINKGNPINEGEPIPPPAQKILMGVVRFIVGRSYILVSVVIIILVTQIDYNGSVLSASFLLPLVLGAAVIISYFKFKNKVLDGFEKQMQSVRFNPAEYKTIRIGFKKKDQDVNLKK